MSTAMLSNSVETGFCLRCGRRSGDHLHKYHRNYDRACQYTPEYDYTRWETGLRLRINSAFHCMCRTVTLVKIDDYFGFIEAAGHVSRSELSERKLYLMKREGYIEVLA